MMHLNTCSSGLFLMHSDRSADRFFERKQPAITTTQTCHYTFLPVALSHAFSKVLVPACAQLSFVHTVQRGCLKYARVGGDLHWEITTRCSAAPQMHPLCCTDRKVY